jgi:hypothetical protein
MHEFHKTLFLGSFCFLISLNAHGDTGSHASGIKDLMTPEQYKSAGLDKLTKDEREALDKWLREDYTGRTGVQSATTPAGIRATTATIVPAATTPPQTTATTVPAGTTSPAESAAPTRGTAATTATAIVAEPASKQVAVQQQQPIPAAQDKNFGFPEPPPEPGEDENVLHAKIVPPFRGWSGKTVFRLDNGQVWKQRHSGRHTYSGDDTRVIISKNRLGLYEMRLLDVDRAVGVRRVK